MSEATATGFNHPGSAALPAAATTQVVFAGTEPARAEALRRRRCGDMPGAAAICAEILRRYPDDAPALHLLGWMAFEAKSAEAAFELLARAAARAPEAAACWIQLGCILRSQGLLEQATSCFRVAAALEPRMAEAHNDLGNALRELGRAEEALAPLIRALDLRPQFSEAALNLASALKDLGRTEEAIACLEKLVEQQPDFAEARANLAGVLGKQERLQEASGQLELAVRQKPGLAAAWNNLGAAHERLGRIEQALACYREAVRLVPEFAEACLNPGVACLLAGRFPEGWPHYEWRLKLKAQRWKRFRRPLWDGSCAAGRRILLVAEQGLGDTIQLVRYVPLPAEAGALVYLECPWRLAPLLRSVPGVARLLASGTVLPDYDFYLPLISPPARLGTDPESIPNRVPYLAVPPAVLTRWRAWLDREANGLRVRLCWASSAQGKNVRLRSMALDQLAELGPAGGITVFSLQRGPQAAELGRTPAGLRVVDLEAQASGIVDTAVAIMNLDLVITVNTMVAHLAGVLGRPVWTRLPFAPDFRWMLSGSDSPWYPIMRLFRQPAPGNRAGAIRQLAAELARWRDSQEAIHHAQHG